EQLIGSAEDVEWLSRRPGRLRRRHLGRVLTVQYAHQNSAARSSDSRVPCYQLLARMRGELSPDDRRAPPLPAPPPPRPPALPPPLLFSPVAESPPLPSPPPEFSFLFLPRNQAALTRRAVDSLLARLSGVQAELVFVDGGSTDTTLDAIRRWAASLPVKL